MNNKSYLNLMRILFEIYLFLMMLRFGLVFQIQSYTRRRVTFFCSTSSCLFSRLLPEDRSFRSFFALSFCDSILYSTLVFTANSFFFSEEFPAMLLQKYSHAQNVHDLIFQGLIFSVTRCSRAYYCHWLTHWLRSAVDICRFWTFLRIRPLDTCTVGSRVLGTSSRGLRCPEVGL